MKRKPDSIVSLFFLFCLGLAITGFTSIVSDSGVNDQVAVATQLTPNGK